MNIRPLGEWVQHKGRKLWSTNPGEMAAKLTLWSVVTKDTVNGFLYTKQSWDNEKIPEDRRKFVAIMDGVNGILNVALQLTLTPWMNKNADKVFNNKLAKNFDTKMAEKIFEKLKGQGANLKQIQDRLDSAKKFSKSGMNVVLTLLFAQILVKRIMTPLIATPTTSKLKSIQQKWVENKKTNKPNSQQEIENETKKPVSVEPFSPFTDNSKVFNNFKMK